MDLATELQKIYDSEINIRIGWLWDGGIEVRLGDEMNGYHAEETVKSISDVLPWLQEAVAHFYPDSTYAKSLDPELRTDAASRRSPAEDRRASHLSKLRISERGEVRDG